MTTMQDKLDKLSIEDRVSYAKAIRGVAEHIYNGGDIEKAVELLVGYAKLLTEAIK